MAITFQFVQRSTAYTPKLQKRVDVFRHPPGTIVPVFSMSQTQWESGIIPARLSFLAIYSPPLGPTDETFQDQIVYYYSRANKEAKSSRKANQALKDKQDALKEEEHEKLRQIGLAQGMVDFARSFSDGQAIDSVETDKSRIVMHELEKGWWVLASVDLTRIPVVSTVNSKAQDNYEYSSREVSPPALLLQQINTAHRIFLLHHGPSLQDLFERIKRERFSNTLDRFWSRFCRDWEVLLHGSPAVDVFGGLKLSSGGELGIGVGEEEWGSGEREVLEDLMRNTEGLVDLTVSRFGEMPTDDDRADDVADRTPDSPWLGSGHIPEAHDGLVFGGIGAISRPCLRDVSAWVQHMYTYGERAYGVGDNPHRQRRKRQRHNPPADATQPATQQDSDDIDLRKKALNTQAQREADPLDVAENDPDLPPLPIDPRPQMHDRVASHDHATGISTPQVASHPGIPPPIVSAAEKALEKATSGAAKSADKIKEGKEDTEPSVSSYGISDRWMRYLTLGLSSGKASTSDTSPQRPTGPSRKSTSWSNTRSSKSQDSSLRSKDASLAETGRNKSAMQYVDPIPDGEAIAVHYAAQRENETRGYFLIGYKGDLQEPSTSTGQAEEDLDDASEGERTVLRTLQIELSNRPSGERTEDEPSSLSSNSSNSADLDRSRIERLRVVVYVCRPFIFTFLFEQRTSTLQISTFYKGLHQHLAPVHKPMARNTSVARVAERIAQSHDASDKPASIRTTNPPYDAPKASPVFDLVYDPVTLTIHTSIPNIPQAGTLAAEGIETQAIGTTSSGKTEPPAWTRMEGLNVHSQILNTLESTRGSAKEIERTCKTSRGWWVVWMRIPPFASTDLAKNDTGRADTVSEAGEETKQGQERQIKMEECRVAFLVRKASDWTAPKSSSISSRVSSGMFGFGKPDERSGTAGANASWGPAALAGGIGIDARKYVEGLLSLNR